MNLNTIFGGTCTFGSLLKKATHIMPLHCNNAQGNVRPTQDIAEKTLHPSGLEQGIVRAPLTFEITVSVSIPESVHRWEKEPL